MFAFHTRLISIHTHTQKLLTDLMQRANPDDPPAWLHCKRALIPDLIARDPNAMPVWEITGAEFTKSDHHTADGLSIRFPRITRQRTDKSAGQATSLEELHRLYEASKECTNLQMLTDGLAMADDDDIRIETKVQKTSPSTSTASRPSRLPAPLPAVRALKRRSDEVDNDEAEHDDDDVPQPAKLPATTEAGGGRAKRAQRGTVQQPSSMSTSTKAATTSAAGGSDCTKSVVSASASGVPVAGCSGSGSSNDKRQKQQKPRYKYQDSSDEWTGDANNEHSNKDGDDGDDATTTAAGAVARDDTPKETKAKIPDMFTVTAAAAAAKTNTLRARRSGADASQLVDRQIGLDFDRAAAAAAGTAHVGAAAAAPVVMENNGITASTPLPSSLHDGPAARNSAINIFEGVVLCVPDGRDVGTAATDDHHHDDGGAADARPVSVRDRVKEELRYFQLWGGRLVWASSAATKECTHALHRRASVRCADWTQLR